jgi:uncharacterized protein (TIGR03437 family)
VYAGKTIAILATAPLLIRALQSGPDPGKTGAPGESLCIESGCHVGAANAGAGSIAIDAGGAIYIPGIRQRIRVAVRDPAQRRWGFQLTARLAGGARTRAGVLSPIDVNTQALCSASNFLELPCTANPTLQYIEHSLAGARTTAPGAGFTWEFDWTPPDTDVGPVVLYAAGNAANGNLLESGDNIYTTSLMLTTGVDAGSRPSISGVVNGASLEPDISANGWVSIQGTALATGSRQWRAADFDGVRLPTGLDGASVRINGKDAFVHSISPARLSVLAPDDTSLGPVSVQVSLDGSAIAASTAQMRQFTPAFFLIDDTNIAATHADGSPLGPGSPARPGEVVVLYGAGFGPTNPPAPNGRIPGGLAALANPVTLRIGGVAVTPLFAGLSAAGLYQFVVQTPSGASSGDVPVIAVIRGISSQLGASISVQR